MDELPDLIIKDSRKNILNIFKACLTLLREEVFLLEVFFSTTLL